MSIVPEPPLANEQAEPSVDKPPEPPVDRGASQAYLLFAICVCMPFGGAPDAPPELPAEQPTDPKPDRGVGQVYLLLAICIGLWLTVGAAIQLWSPYVGMAIDQTLLMFVPAVLYVRRKRLPVAEALRWRPISSATALLGAVLGVSGFGVAVEIVNLTTPILGRGPEIDFFESYTLPQLAVTLFCVSLLPGVCEETLFRGVIQGTLERLGAVKAVAITSLLFALVHFNPWNFLSPLFWGVVVGVVALRTGSTIPTMIAHASANATEILLAYQLRDEDESKFQIVTAALAAVFVIVFSIYLVKTRDQTLQPSSLARVPAGLSWWALAGLAAVGLLMILACVV